MTIYLVSHAEAEPPDTWHLAADPLRPLTDHGSGQAMAIAHSLDSTPLRFVLTSPTVRCTSTVLPVAVAHNIDLRTRQELLHTSAAVSLVGQLIAAENDVVVCSDSDIIRHVLASLDRRNADRTFEVPTAGSMYVLDTESDGVAINYLPPPPPQVVRPQRPHRTGVVSGGGGYHH